MHYRRKTATRRAADGSVVYSSGSGVSPESRRYDYAGAWGYQGDLYPAVGAGGVGSVRPFTPVGHRWYDPATGRLLQRDPMGIGGGLNVYDYVWNGPPRMVDPLGFGGYFTGGGFQGRIRDFREPDDKEDAIPDGISDCCEDTRPPPVNIPVSCSVIWTSIKNGAADGATAGTLIGAGVGGYMGAVGVGLPTCGVAAPAGAGIGVVAGGGAGAVIGAVIGGIGSGVGTLIGQLYY